MSRETKQVEERKTKMERGGKVPVVKNTRLAREDTPDLGLS